MSNTIPILYLIIPCYNEERVLPITAPLFLNEIESLIESNLISPSSRILFVNDGSTDTTWDLILDFSSQNEIYEGISQSRNRGHQNAVLAGLMEAKDLCDITISIDCDGQDDIHAITSMVQEYLDGNEIVYGVRNNRDSDSFFKRTSAQAFYKLMNAMGVETVYNHADYRLISSRVLNEFADFKEVNLFLRGMIPLVGFQSTSVYYSRQERMGGESHYPLSKMFGLAFDGITSLSVRPIRIITLIGLLFFAASIIGIMYALISLITGNIVPGWVSIICILFFSSGLQMLSLGVIGEYIGKIYMETKARPRYIISERTYDVKETLAKQ